MRYSLGDVKKEYCFSWPLVESVPEEDKVKFWFRRAPRETERNILASISRFITDERTQTTQQHVDLNQMDKLYAVCLTKIENLEVTQEDGDPAPPIDDKNRLSRIQNFLTGNLGLDVEKYGSLEEELSRWFAKVILRRSDDLRKNSTTPQNDSSAAKE